MSSFTDVLEKAHALHERSRTEGSSIWFRGQAQSTWSLWSTAHRYIIRVNEEFGDPWPQEELQDLLRKEVKSEFHRFKAVASPFLDQLQRSDWGYVFAMQHYGLSSRLLDWTTSFSCALFFANVGWSRAGNAAIFIVNPSVLNEESTGVNSEMILDSNLVNTNIPTARLHPGIIAPDGPLPSIAVLPVYTNSRMVVQHARFIICGDLFKPIEIQFARAVTKLELTPDMADEIDRYLALVGMDWASYFPDVDGLARQYKHKEEFTLNTIRKIRGKLDT